MTNRDTKTRRRLAQYAVGRRFNRHIFFSPGAYHDGSRNEDVEGARDTRQLKLRATCARARATPRHVERRNRWAPTDVRSAASREKWYRGLSPSSAIVKMAGISLRE